MTRRPDPLIRRTRNRSVMCGRRGAVPTREAAEVQRDEDEGPRKRSRLDEIWEGK